jgi:hypothetical protein
VFVLYKIVLAVYKKGHTAKKMSSRRESMKTTEFAELQLELFGEKALRNLKHIGSVADLEKLMGSIHSNSSKRLTIVSSSDSSDNKHADEMVVELDDERNSQYSV